MVASKQQVTGVLLAICLAGAGGFLGGRALGAAEKKGHFDADSDEMTRTQVHLQTSIATAVSTMKGIAKETTLANAETTKEQREQAINSSLKPLQEEGLLLMLQTHLLCVDHIADESPDMVGPFLRTGIYDKLGVSAEEVDKRREATGLGHGGLILGYLVSKQSGKPADAVFALKAGKSWPEVLQALNVSAAKLGELLK